MNKILKISAIVILLVALTYMIVGTFFMNSSKTSTEFSGFGKMVSRVPNALSRSTDELEVALDKILINLNSGEYKYIKADISFKMRDEENKDKLVNNMSSVRNAVLRFTSGLNSDILATEQGKQQYKEDLKAMLSNSFGYEVEAVYFRNFVLAR